GRSGGEGTAGAEVKRCDLRPAATLSKPDLDVVLRRATPALPGCGAGARVGKGIDWIHPPALPGISPPTAGENGVSLMAEPDKALDQSLLEELAALDDSAQRKAFLRRNPALVRREYVTKMTEEVWRRVRIDTQVARRFADVAIELAEQLGDPEAQAQSLRAKANTLYSLGEYAMAVELHESAARIFEALGNPSEVARTLSSSIQPLLLLGNYDRALEAGERARIIFQTQGNARRLARVEINIGNIFHRQGRFDEALAC